jgi:hypothetical protein
MTLKEKLQKAKLLNKYTIERDNYIEAMRRNDDYVNYHTLKAAEFQQKINVLNEVKDEPSV